MKNISGIQFKMFVKLLKYNLQSFIRYNMNIVYARKRISVNLSNDL